MPCRMRRVLLEHRRLSGLEPILGGLEIVLVDIEAEETAVHVQGGDAGGPDAHEWVEHEVARFGSELHEVLQDADGLLSRVERVLQALLPHADGGFNKVVHLFLEGEVPCMPLVPHANDELAAIEEPRPVNL